MVKVSDEFTLMIDYAHNAVPRLAVVDGIGNGLLSVANLHIFTVRLRNPGFDMPWR